MRRRLRALQAARPREVLLLLRLVAVATVVPMLMRLPLPRLERLLEPGRVSRPRPERWEAVPRLVEAAIVAFRPLVRPGCLTRGITSYAFLRRAGLDVALCFGVGDVEGREEGHCWLVRDGEPWLEDVDPREHFVAMACFPSSRSPAGA